MSKDYLISKVVGSKIIYYRKMNGITLRELADTIGVSEQQQSRYERGVNRINLDRLWQYADYFEIGIKDLLDINEK
ncbi:TPA: helix-turn-helix transcriptional regulator [Providencia alcalifaciens]|uniref:helix-turn-helix domain-containing protein n=1 Tax=Providencia sp. wls1950 TaxID=2675147 RepID=UPI0012B5388E|nr:helix-turn-helix transcriptional regulator [Providencia sp. wls1950]MTB46734.1 helix-turn-helix domain-containing protein [Providencia sp. wls1950]